MKVALVHDYLNQFGGAERVVSALHEIFPDAPIFTSICDLMQLPPVFHQINIKTSYMQNIPWIFKLYRHFFFLYPWAIKSFDLSGFDLIISSSSAYAKGIRKPAGAKHICYCHSPARFIWDYENYAGREKFPSSLKLVLPWLKLLDLKAAAKVDLFIANSKRTGKKISQIYQRASSVIYPPVDMAFFTAPLKKENYYLAVGRLVPYKRYDLVIEAFNQLRLPLKIIGAGPALEAYRKMAGPHIEFLGKVSEESVKMYYGQSKAVIFPERSDLGLVPLEAAAGGTPSIAFKGGGAAETVIDGRTGILFEEQTVESLKSAIERFEKIKFDLQALVDQAKQFSKTVFKEKILNFIKENIHELQN